MREENCVETPVKLTIKGDACKGQHIQIPNIEVSPKYICRICHQQSPKKGLIGECQCQGSIGRVHKDCMERWLTVSHTNNCELCGTSFVVYQEKPGFREYMGTNPRSLITKFYVFILITSTVILLMALCSHGMIVQLKWQKTAELIFLASFLTVLLLTYLGWTVRTAYDIYIEYRNWARRNPNLRIHLDNSTMTADSIIAAVNNSLNSSGNDEDDESTERVNSTLITSGQPRAILLRSGTSFFTNNP